jgi:hypothetical protein
MRRLALIAGIAAVLTACGASSKSPSTTLSATTTITKTGVVTTQTSGPTSIILRFVDPSENSLYIQMSGQPGLIRVVREAVMQRLNPFPDFKGHRMGWTVSPIARGPKDCTRTLRIRTALRGLAPGEYFKKYAGQKIKLVIYGGAVPGAPGCSSFPQDMFCHRTLFALQSL